MMSPEDYQLREIEFRGKEFHYMTSVWIFGFYDGSGSCSRIIDSDGNFHLVLPETVCQFTGLLDNKGNRVYEGDVVALRLDYHTSKHIGVVKWQCSGGYIVWSERESGIRVWDGSITKVLGNVFDNPALKSKFGPVWTKEIKIK